MNTRNPAHNKPGTVTANDKIEGELELLYRTAPVGLAHLDTDLRYIRINDRLAEICGLRSEDIIGRTIQEIIPEIAKKVAPIYRQVFETGNSSLNNRIETVLPSDPSRQRAFLASYHPLKNASGQVIAVSTVVQEITDLEVTQARLESTHNRLNVLMDHGPAIIYIKDSRKKHVYGNKVLLEKFDITREEFLGTASRDFLPLDMAENLESLDEAILSGRSGSETVEYRIEIDGKETCWQDTKFPIETPSGERLVGGIAVEITELKEAEKRLTQELQFEELVSELSTEFINMPPDQVDDKLNDALGRICKFMNLDRGVIDQFSVDRTRYRVTHVWALPGVPMPADMHERILNEELPWLTDTVLSGKSIVFSDPDEFFPPEAVNERARCKQVGIKSSAIVPLLIGGEVIGACGFSSMRDHREWSEEFLRRLWLLSQIFAHALERQRAEKKLHEAFAEVKALKDRAEAENRYLRKEIQLDKAHGSIVGQSEVLRQALEKVEQVAGTESTVLIEGETGTGKEMIAEAIHGLSARKKKIMVKVNCAALPETLVESELFGREKGAYTGAMSKQAGRFEIADGSTIFLDEIAELSLDVQAKLLRVLHEGVFERLGSPNPVKVDVRVIAATNRDLEQAVKKGLFREDLYYRLSVFPLHVPPLRERSEDIPQLVWHFVREFSEQMGKRIDHVSKRTMEALQRYSWPGNVRQLRNVIEHAMIISQGSKLIIELPKTIDTTSTLGPTLVEVERRHITAVLEKTRWRVRGEHGAAESLGLKPTTLEFRMKKLGIIRPG